MSDETEALKIVAAMAGFSQMLASISEALATIAGQCEIAPPIATATAIGVLAQVVSQSSETAAILCQRALERFTEAGAELASLRKSIGETEANGRENETPEKGTHE